MKHVILFLVGHVALVILATAPAGADGWRVSGELDLDTLAQSGIAGSIGVTPARLPRWRFAVAMRSHDIPDFQTSVASTNDGLYASIPIALEASAQRKLANNVVLGALAGVVHFHFARSGTFGIDEEFAWGITPFVAYEWSPVDHVYVKPWLGAMAPLFRQRHGELPMAEADRTYSKWPTLIRGGVALGVEY